MSPYSNMGQRLLTIGSYSGETQVLSANWFPGTLATLGHLDAPIYIGLCYDIERIIEPRPEALLPEGGDSLYQLSAIPSMYVPHHP